MAINRIPPAILLETLLERKCRPERRRNLNLLNKICEAQQAASRDFRLSIIGKIFEAAGGVKARALHNKPSEDYRALILAWQDHSEPPSENSLEFNEKDIAFSQVEDPVLRTLLQSLAAENKKLRGELNLLKSVTNFVVDKRPKVVGSTSISINFTQTERLALERAISPQFLRGEGWVEGDRGEIRLGNRLIFEFGYVRAIRKIINHIDPDVGQLF